MKRVAVLFVAILVLGLAPTFASAQGFLPGLPSFGSFLGGPASCGQSCDPGLPGPTFYVGWGTTTRHTGYGIGAENTGVGGIGQVDGAYDSTGAWLGLTVPLRLTERVSFLASGWYLIPGNTTNAFESYRSIAGATLGARNWDAKNEWWFVDGLLAFSCGGGSGFAFLAGARYDYYTTHLQNSGNGLFGFGLASDRADLTAYNVIPLFGVQTALTGARGGFLLRFVGVPALAGTVKYEETLGAIGNRLETKGSWSNGYFWEIFAEATVKAFGSSSMGGFVRYNEAHGNASVDTDLLGGALVNDTFKLGFNRSTVTVGGSFQLDFITPSRPF